ncbi:MAG: S1 family peptidase, partial [Methyloligellaceae bacterium]
GIPSSTGVGFYFEDNLIATSFHLLRDANAIHIRNIGTGAETKDARIKSYSAEFDVAVLKSGMSASPLKLASGSEGREGDVVVAIGNPGGLPASMSAGTIRGVRAINGSPVYQISAPVSPGSSGGPVFDGDGAVVGITTFSLKNAQSLNLAMPVSVIAPLADKDMAWKRTQLIYTMQPDNKEISSISLSKFSKAGTSTEEEVSLKNNTQEAIENVRFVMVYKDRGGQVFDHRLRQVAGPIPPGSVQTQKFESFDANNKFSYSEEIETCPWCYELFWVDLRVLSYNIAGY